MTEVDRHHEDGGYDGDEHDANLRAEGVPDARNFGVATSSDDEEDSDD